MPAPFTRSAQDTRGHLRHSHIGGKLSLRGEPFRSTAGPKPGPARLPASEAGPRPQANQRRPLLVTSVR